MKLTALKTIQHEDETFNRGDVFEIDEKDHAQRLIDTDAALEGEQQLEDEENAEPSTESN